MIVHGIIYRGGASTQEDSETFRSHGAMLSRE